MSKIIFKKWKNIIGMHFGTKSYLKSNRYGTVKHTMQKGKTGFCFFQRTCFPLLFSVWWVTKMKSDCAIGKGIKERTYLWGNICINWHKEKEKGPGRDLGGKQMRTKQIPCLLLCLVIWIAYLPLNCHPLCTNFRPTLYSGKQLLLI
jgi:hypothetical protein